MPTKRIGQISALYIGNTPPQNTKLIWYDSTPSQRCHKVYDHAKGEWVVIDQKIVSRITYSEITSLASRTGLSIGKFYAITDKGNILALAITSTKVQYTDIGGNQIIDDLGVNKKYIVNSSNLLVDDIEGVFDETAKKLVFRFQDTELPNENDYILAKGQRNGVWKLLKCRLSRFISKDAGNSIKWQNGFFFSIAVAVKNYLDREGGIVSYEKYQRDIKSQTDILQKMAKNSQNLPKDIDKKIKEETRDGKIYNKTLQVELADYTPPVDPRKGDSLNILLSKLWSWIKTLKTSKGIAIGVEYQEADSRQYVNTNDSVQTAIGKIMYWLRNMSEYLKTSEAFSPNTKADNLPMSTIEVAPGDELNIAIEKLQGQIRMLGLVDNGSLSFGENHLKLKQGSLVLNKLISSNAWVRTALGVSSSSGEIRTAGRGLTIYSDYVNTPHYSTLAEYLRGNPMVQARSMVADDFGVFSSGSSIVYWTLKRGNFIDYNKEENRVRVASSIVGLFNLDYAQRGVVPSNAAPQGNYGTPFDRNNVIYAGIFGSVDMRSVDDDDGSAGLIDMGDWNWHDSGNNIYLNKLWFGGVFDRLLARGLVYGYANSAGASDYLYSMKSTSDKILISQFDTFVEINAGSSTTGGLLTKSISLPLAPVPGQMIKVLITTIGRTPTDLAHKVRIHPHTGQDSLPQHRQFHFKDGSSSAYLALSVGVLYEFLYTSVGWKCFSQNPHEVKP